MFKFTSDDLSRMSDRSDAQLVKDILNGRRELYAVLMRRHSQRVFRIARGLLRSDADAQDACHDAYVRAYQELDELAEPAGFGGWVARIVANLALRRLRRQKTWPGLPERGDPACISDEVPTHAPDHDASRKQLRAILEETIDQVPTVYRAVLVMCDVEGMTADEASEMLDVAAGIVQIRLHWARRLMREYLGTHLDDVDVAGAFAFEGERCDRLVVGVLGDLHATGLLECCASS